MKKYLIIILSLFLFASCEKIGPQIQPEPEEGVPAKKTGIYVQFATERTILSYTDDNPGIGNNVSPGISYGPCSAGRYLFTADLEEIGRINQQAYTLANPAAGFSLRTYTITFYFDYNLNRWLYKYPFVDSK